MTRTKNKTKLIIFLIDQAQSEQKYFGFKLLSLDETKRFLLAVKRLQQHNISFNIGSQTFEYNSNYFSMISLSSGDEKVLLNLFDINNDGIADGYVGIIPDAILDAYNEGLLDEDQQLQHDNQYDSQDDEF